VVTNIDEIAAMARATPIPKITFEEIELIVRCTKITY
jgi:hypothetical protein